MIRQWSFLTNPFLTATEGSYRTMKKISDFTFYAIKNQLPPPALMKGGMVQPSLVGDDVEFYDELFADLSPLVNDFDARFAAWQDSFAERKSQTNRFTELLSQLRSEKIRDWDINIQTVYKVNSPGYVRLLPNRRIPFQGGQQNDRIDAVGMLSRQIATDTAFDGDFIAEIADFYTQLKTEYEKQSSEKSDTSLASHDLEPARLALAQGLYASLGAMMKHFNTQPDKIAAFFDLELIRTTEQVTYRHKVKPLSSYHALTHTFQSGDMVRLVNDGKVPLIFWLAANLNDAPGESVVTVESFTEKIVTASELGNLTNRLLKVKNAHEMVEGHYVITLM